MGLKLAGRPPPGGGGVGLGVVCVGALVRGGGGGRAH